MKNLKKLLGIVWIALGLAAAWFAITDLGWPRFISAKPDDQIFGGIILFVLTPIITGGLVVFGKYAWANEYSAEKP